MVEKSGEKVYLVRLYREDGEMEEMFMSAPNDKVALDNAEKGFERKFEILEKSEEILVLEEV